MPKLILSKSFFLCLLLSSITAFASPHGAELFHFKGDVSIKTSEGEFERPEEDDFLVEGDFVKTGSDGLAIVRFADNSTLRITPNSEIQIESLVEPIDGQILGSTNIFLKMGQLFINVINNDQAPVFHVKTNKVAMGVRGTRFFAGIDKSTGHTELAVNKGTVEISNPSNLSHREAIETGQGIHVEDGQFSLPQKYDWVKDLDYNTEKKTIDLEKNKSLHIKKREEYLKKRKDWVRDENTWNLHQQRWAKLKKRHELRAEKLKNKRIKFKKSREEFKSRKKSLMKSRDSLKLEARKLGREAFRLKKNEKKIRREMGRLRNGRNDPRSKLQLTKNRSALKRDKVALQSARKALKESRLKLKGEKEALINEFKKNRKKASRVKSKANQYKKKSKKKARRIKRRNRKLKKKMEQSRPSNSGSAGGGDSGNSL